MIVVRLMVAVALCIGVLPDVFAAAVPFTLGGVQFAGSSSATVFEQILARNPTATFALEKAGSTVATAAVASRWIGWGAAIQAGLLVKSLIFDTYSSGPIQLLPSKNSTLPYYAGGSETPPSTSSFYSPWPTNNVVSDSSACSMMALQSYLYNPSTTWLYYREQVGVALPSPPAGASSWNVITACNYVNGVPQRLLAVPVALSCPAGYSPQTSGNGCYLSNAALAKWDQSLATVPVYVPGDSSTGWVNDVRYPGQPLTNGVVPTSGPIVTLGIDANTGQTVMQTATPKPGGGFDYSTSVQNNTAGQSFSTNNQMSVGPTGVVTGVQSSTTPGTPGQSSTSSPISTPVSIDPNTGQLTNVVNNNSTVNNNINLPTDYARDATVSKTNDKLDTLHNDLITPLPAPSLPSVPQSSELIDVFFKGTFDGLLSWQMPGHMSECPKPVLSDGRGHSVEMSSHCDLWAANSSTISAVMTVVWTMISLFIVLRA